MAITEFDYDKHCEAHNKARLLQLKKATKELKRELELALEHLRLECYNIVQYGEKVAVCNKNGSVCRRVVNELPHERGFGGYAAWQYSIEAIINTHGEAAAIVVYEYAHPPYLPF